MLHVISPWLCAMELSDIARPEWALVCIPLPSSAHLGFYLLVTVKCDRMLCCVRYKLDFLFVVFTRICAEEGLNARCVDNKTTREDWNYDAKQACIYWVGYYCCRSKFGIINWIVSLQNCWLSSE